MKKFVERQSKTLGIIVILLGIVLSPSLVERAFSTDFNISSSGLRLLIRCLQTFLLIYGAMLFLLRWPIAFGRPLLALSFVMVFGFHGFIKNYSFQLNFVDSVLQKGCCARDDISQYETKFTELKNDIPKGEVVAYVTSEKNDLESVSFMKHYFITQYALAPILVDGINLHRFVIGNYVAQGSYSDSKKPQHLILRKRYSSEIVLFEYREPRWK